MNGWITGFAIKPDNPRLVIVHYYDAAVWGLARWCGDENGWVNENGYKRTEPSYWHELPGRPQPQGNQK